jgi:hypothetical protein
MLEAGLEEAASEDLHQAVRVCVVVDRGAFAWCPDEDELVVSLSALICFN